MSRTQHPFDIFLFKKNNGLKKSNHPNINRTSLVKYLLKKQIFKKFDRKHLAFSFHEWMVNFIQLRWLEGNTYFKHSRV